MPQEQIGFQEVPYSSLGFINSSDLSAGSSSFREKLDVDLKYRNFSDPCTYFFDKEGKILGAHKGKYVVSLLERLSARIEGLSMENFLKSTLFGSISLVKI